MTDDEKFEQFIASPALNQMVVRNTDRFREKWKRMFAKAQTIQKMQATRSWNWPSFLLPGVWMLYRRMYLYGAVYLAGLAFVYGLAQFTGKGSFNIIGLVIAVTCGLYGDGWYFRHVYDRTSSLEGETTPSAKGGVSWVAAISGAVAYIAVNIAVMAFGVMGIANNTELNNSADELAATREATDASDVWHRGLVEMNGVWTTEEGAQSKIRFNRDSSAVDNYLANILQADADGVTYTETDTSAAELEIGREIKESFEKEYGKELPVLPLTLRKKWDQNRESFTLVKLRSGSAPVELSFVRELTPEEETFLASAKVRAMAAKSADDALIERQRAAAGAAASASAQQKSAILEVPGAKEAAQRLGAGKAFFDLTPEKQVMELTNSLPGVERRLDNDRRELAQIDATRAVSDFDEEERQKRRAALRESISKDGQTQADLKLLLNAASGSAADPVSEVPEGGGAKADGYDEGEYLDNRWVEDQLTAEFRNCVSADNKASAANLACVTDETKRQDERLNSTYKTVIAGMASDGAAKLRQSEREWIVERDAQCKEADRQASPDIALPSTYASCYLARTLERVLELQRLTTKP
ncbi:MAG: lysozyme inhibitor LprI family protein [Rhodospirillaceae bacterium]|nr:lysozyme inhibitor LprI family protein [Rhodospirillaceae bacterium]